MPARGDIFTKQTTTTMEQNICCPIYLVYEQTNSLHTKPPSYSTPNPIDRSNTVRKLLQQKNKRLNGLLEEAGAPNERRPPRSAAQVNLFLSVLVGGLEPTVKPFSRKCTLCVSFVMQKMIGIAVPQNSYFALLNKPSLFFKKNVTSTCSFFSLKWLVHRDK
jgi:hypothetical protein